MMSHILSLHDKIDILSERLGLGLLSGQGDGGDDYEDEEDENGSNGN